MVEVDCKPDMPEKKYVSLSADLDLGLKGRVIIFFLSEAATSCSKDRARKGCAATHPGLWVCPRYFWSSNLS